MVRCAPLLLPSQVPLDFGIDILISPLECAGIRGYLGTLIFYMIFPLCLAAAIFCVFLVIEVKERSRAHTASGGSGSAQKLQQRRVPSVARTARSILGCATAVVPAMRKRFGSREATLGTLRRASPILRAALIKSTPLQLKWLFLLFPIITNMVFEAWPCYDFSDGDAQKSYLKVDVSVACDGAEHNELLGVAMCGVIVYAGGLIVLNATLLYQIRHAIRSEKQTELSNALAFLHREYAPLACWWELVEMARRFLLVGLFRIIDPGTVTQLILATLLVTLHLVLQIQTQPFRSKSDAYLAMAVTISLFIELFCCNLYKFQELVEQVAAQDAQLQTETRILRLFRFNSGFVTVLIMSSIVASMLFAMGLTILKAHEDRRKEIEEREAIAARHLHRVADDNDVVPPSIPGDHYNCFLSHVWGTGQDQMRVVKTRLNEMIPGLRVFLDVDDLKEGRGMEYVDRSDVVLIFCSDGYFVSQNCMRECLRAIFQGKHLVTLLEPDRHHGSLSRDQIRNQLVEADDLYATWGLDEEMREWGFPKPTPAQMLDHIFGAQPPIEWNRLGAYQDVSMKLIAMRLLPEGHGPTYLKGEITRQHLFIPRPRRLCNYHLYISRYNEGAKELINELEYFLDEKMASGEGSSQRGARGSVRRSHLCRTSLPWRRSSRVEPGPSGLRRLVSFPRAESNTSAGDSCDSVYSSDESCPNWRSAATASVAANRLSTLLGLRRLAAVRRQRWRDAVTAAPAACALGSKEVPPAEGVGSDARVGVERRTVARVAVSATTRKSRLSSLRLRPSLRKRSKIVSCANARTSIKRTDVITRQLKVTQDPIRLVRCERMLIYLNGLTWTSGEVSASLAAEIARALALGIPVQLVHEMPGEGGQAERHGCADPSCARQGPRASHMRPSHDAIPF